MLKFCAKFFCVLSLILFSSSFVFADPPSWYTGSEKLYNEFVHGCKVAMAKCPNKIPSCEVSSQEDFDKVYLNVKTCISYNQCPPSDDSCTVRGKSTSMASSRA